LQVEEAEEEERETEFLLFRNIGQEAALDVSMVPIELGDVSIGTSSKIASLTPADAPVERSFWVSGAVWRFGNS
jgi:hypothetical protein